jgi:hypothetical protein
LLRRHYSCGRECRDECHDGPYTDLDLTALTDDLADEREVSVRHGKQKKSCWANGVKGFAAKQ